MHSSSRTIAPALCQNQIRLQPAGEGAMAEAPPQLQGFAAPASRCLRHVRFYGCRCGAVQAARNLARCPLGSQPGLTSSFQAAQRRANGHTEGLSLPSRDGAPPSTYSSASAAEGGENTYEHPRTSPLTHGGPRESPPRFPPFNSPPVWHLDRVRPQLALPSSTSLQRLASRPYPQQIYPSLGELPAVH